MNKIQAGCQEHKHLWLPPQLHRGGGDDVAEGADAWLVRQGDDWTGIERSWKVQVRP